MSGQLSQVQTGQIGQNIDLKLELADLTVKLGHFDLTVDLFPLCLTEEIAAFSISYSLNQFWFSSGDFGRVAIMLAG